MAQIKNILVPIDFSTSSYQVFEIGHCMAKHNGANLASSACYRSGLLQ